MKLHELNVCCSGMKQEQQNIMYLTDRARFGPIIWQAPDMNNDCIIFMDWK